ncbi:MAG: hypothetical protein BroJett042_24370 [Bacteroidota bacterium]|nr:MAG: hypothetical protein BroJett042_24370 [Bacteroidota bacterium]HNR73779.1 hypothetical protein [Cyclobacteriaceae bacterium]HNU41551.1 hypothetical protein [Cyclobacteriaceae bacterium]
MAIIVKVTRKTKPETIQKALRKMAGKRAAGNKKTIADFYGALPSTYGDGLTYQKQLRDEW